jgi:hypothetical protein
LKLNIKDSLIGIQMAVYVDKAKHAYGRMIMCHMLADTVGELHAMADVIGVNRKWFQNHGTPHYDICLSKRSLAIKAGAQEIDRHETGALIKKLREQRLMDGILGGM